jgi:anti-sigma factor RsiW
MTSKHLDALTLNAWADGLLEPDERRQAAAHLAACDRCRARAAGQAQMAHLLRHLPAEPPPPFLAHRIVARLARQPRRRPAWALPAATAQAALTWLSAAAALVGLALVVLAWPDVARLIAAGAGLPSANLAALLDLPADTLGALANSTFDWASVLTGGAGVALMTGLVLLTAGAFGGLIQLLRPAPGYAPAAS